MLKIHYNLKHNVNTIILNDMDKDFLLTAIHTLPSNHNVEDANGGRIRNRFGYD